MHFNIKDFETLVSKVYAEQPTKSMHAYCTSKIAGDIEKLYDGSVKLNIHGTPYVDDDKIYIIPDEEKTIKLTFEDIFDIELCKKCSSFEQCAQYAAQDEIVVKCIRFGILKQYMLDQIYDELMKGLNQQ